MFDFFRRRKDKPTPKDKGEAPAGYEAWVFWPSGERQQVLLDPAKLDERALGGARNWLTGLSITGSIVRGSAATGRTQTLASVARSSAGVPLAVRITGDGDKPLAVMAVFGERHDAAGVREALGSVAAAAKIPMQELTAIVDKCATRNGIAIATHGPSNDAAVDEAYGMALCLGAAMNESASTPAGAPTVTPAAASPVAAPAGKSSGIPVGEITLERLAILHQRSAFILCGFAPGSREQAQEWDNWVERYRLPSVEAGMARLAEVGQENVAVVNLFVGKGFWSELRTMPIRFVGIHGSTASYAIPWDGQNVPDITDFSPPDPSQGSRQAAIASIAGKVEPLTP